MADQGARGLFLDLDGTLADSMKVMSAATQQFFDDLGIKREKGRKRHYELAGRTPRDIMTKLKEHYGLSQPVPELVEQYFSHVHESYGEQATVMPGGRALLSAAREHGVFCAVVTSSLRSVAQGFLERKGLEGFIDAVVSMEDIDQGKPHPEPYLLALSISGLSAQRVMAVEDAPMGAASAIAAGLTTWIMAPEGRGDFPEIAGVAGFIKRLDELIPYLSAA